jgi:hypothetical protein
LPSLSQSATRSGGTEPCATAFSTVLPQAAKSNKTNLKRCLELASSCYGSAPPSIRKLFNQAFFAKLYIDDEDTVRSELAPPFDLLLSPALRQAARTTAVAASEYKNAPKKSFLEGVRQIWTTVVAGLKELGLVGAPGIEIGRTLID